MDLVKVYNFRSPAGEILNKEVVIVGTMTKSLAEIEEYIIQLQQAAEEVRAFEASKPRNEQMAIL